MYTGLYKTARPTVFDMHSDFYDCPTRRINGLSFKNRIQQYARLISYVNGNTVLSKRYAHDAKTVYPDNDVSSQVYCSKDFLELTVQSPFVSH